MSFPINITHVTYDLYFDDGDGAAFYPYSYDPLNDIYVATMDSDMSSSPLEIAAVSTSNIYELFISYNIELAIRLNDEYTLDNDRHIDILNGELTVKLESFEITLNFAFYNLYVPN